MLWTFGKGKQRISLGREAESNVLVVVRGRDQLREHRFKDAAELHVFQSDMEAFLRRTGWTLLEFHPERRRRNPDSRRSKHLKERRRFWTEDKEEADQPAESEAKAGSKG